MREEYIYIGPGMIAKNEGPKSRDRKDIEPFSGNNDPDQPTEQKTDMKAHREVQLAIM